MQVPNGIRPMSLWHGYLYLCADNNEYISKLIIILTALYAIEYEFGQINRCVVKFANKYVSIVRMSINVAKNGIKSFPCILYNKHLNHALVVFYFATRAVRGQRRSTIYILSQK